MRQAIHTLRDRLEPDRPKGKPSGYVVARTGGYELAPGRVCDRRRRLRGARPRRAGGAAARRRRARRRRRSPPRPRAYGGDFLADEPYAEWALAERERLRELAAQVLRGARRRSSATPATTRPPAEHLQRLAELEPLDLQAQRDLIALMLRRGRHSEALRRYELVRRRYQRAFGAEPASRSPS